MAGKTNGERELDWTIYLRPGQVHETRICMPDGVTSIHLVIQVAQEPERRLLN